MSDWVDELRERNAVLRDNCACARGMEGVLRLLDAYTRLQRDYEALYAAAQAERQADRPKCQCRSGSPDQSHWAED